MKNTLVYRGNLKFRVIYEWYLVLAISGAFTSGV